MKYYYVICEGPHDRAGNIITELIWKGRIKHTDLERLFSGRIEDE